jgi:hypothetical protein
MRGIRLEGLASPVGARARRTEDPDGVSTSVKDNISAVLHAVLKHTRLDDDDKEAVIQEITRLRGIYVKRVVRPVAEQAHALALLYCLRTGYVIDGVEVVKKDALLAKELPTMTALKDMDVRIPDISSGQKYLHEVFESLGRDGKQEVEEIQFNTTTQRVVPAEMMMRDRETLKRAIQAKSLPEDASLIKPSQLLLKPLPRFNGCI